MVEQKEPHAGVMAFADVAQPGTFAERCTLARRMRDELEVPLPIYVDGMDDASRALFSDLPSPAFLIDRAGRIADKLPWADPAPLAAALRAVLAGDTAMPATKTGDHSLDQRDTFARRLLAAGKPDEALAWLAAKPEPAPPVPPALDAVARAAVTRALALAAKNASASERTAAIDEARTAIAAAWADDAAHRAAARIQLAEAASGIEAEVPLWREALGDLDARAPALTRVWLQQRAAPSNKR